MALLDSIHRCSIGSAGFQLIDFEEVNEPVVRDGRQTGRRLSLRGDGWVESDPANPTDLAEKIVSAVSAFTLSGRDVIVYGPSGSTLRSIPAASCLNGGPHVGFRILPGLRDAAGIRRFGFEISAETVELNGQPAAGPTYQVKVETSPDGIRIITWTGELSTGAGSAAAAFVELGETFSKAYPLPRWSLSHTFEQNLTGDKGRFTLTVEENHTDLPANGTAAVAVSGSASVRTVRDEQMRLTTVYDFDVLVTGDVAQLLTELRPKVPVLHEVVHVGKFPHQRLTASFVTLTGGNGNALMNWSASFVYVMPALIHDPIQFGGTDILFVATKGVRPGRLTFTGFSVGAGVYINPPAVPADDYPLAEAPVITWSAPNEIERRTAWTYVLWVHPDEILNVERLRHMLLRPTQNVPPIPAHLAPKLAAQ